MIYPDASLLIAAIVPEPMTEQALALLSNPAHDDLLASDWLVTEIASALAIKQRTRQIGPDDRVRGLANARSLIAASFTMVPIVPGHCRTATALIERSTLPLRGGDALHLAIASSSGATLWTLDRRMAAAGQGLGLAVRLLA